MKIGLVGYQGSGKSTLFHWLTGVAPDLSLAHAGQSAMAAVPDDRIEQLTAIYHPKKITMASLELVDTPGLSRKQEGNAQKLALIRDTGCLVLVVAAFDGSDPAADVKSFAEDSLLADLQIVTGRLERLRESVKKPRPSRDQEMAEIAALEPLLAALEDNKPVPADQMTEEQVKATRSFALLTQKPTLVIVNCADDERDLERWSSAVGAAHDAVAVRVGLELELAGMDAEDRVEFEQELGLTGSRRDDLLRRIMAASGQMLYFTAGEKEVRTWMMRAGGTALEAADNIHSDLARGFIRAEVMTCSDLVRLGGEREVKADNLVRQEPKDYVVQDDDILNIRFSV